MDGLQEKEEKVTPEAVLKLNTEMEVLEKEHKTVLFSVMTQFHIVEDYSGPLRGSTCWQSSVLE